jgi:hypothetical protein
VQNIVFASIILLVGILLGYLAPRPTVIPVQSDSQSSVSTLPVPASWKTYTSQAYAFTLHYPDDWTYAVRNNDTQISFDTPTHTDGSDGKVLGKITLEINQAKSPLHSLDDAINESTNATISQPQLVTKFLIGTLPVAEVHHTSCPDNTDCITFIFYKNDTIFSLYSNAGDERYTNMPVIYQMLSSFNANQ